ncbi:hypothetical protein CYMTET_11648 [Cymbomonas tetramitiformis]|uniref:Component of SCAR regulatory complex n=1 Tax=Cymbomonas tetramitiformis TaxID=36881 RepID=A0AAE0GM15_9CHLO|nr:hypothetical protein CYMTET_11648 [Cymbomonas tetramitiformis]
MSTISASFVCEGRTRPTHGQRLGRYREFYLEMSNAVQFPIEMSLPWMLLEQDGLPPLPAGSPRALDASPATGISLWGRALPWSYSLGRSAVAADSSMVQLALVPFDIYNDAADEAINTFHQRFLFDEIQAEVDLCFDQMVFKISDQIMEFNKCAAANQCLDNVFKKETEMPLDKGAERARCYEVLFNMRHVQILARTLDLNYLFSQRINKLFRENLDYIMERCEASEAVHIIEVEKLIMVMQTTHTALSEHLRLDDFDSMYLEMTESASMVAFTNRILAHFGEELVHDIIPNFAFCTATQRFVRAAKTYYERPYLRAAMPSTVKLSLLFGNKHLNTAFTHILELYTGFFGQPHLAALSRLMPSSHSRLAWLVEKLLDRMKTLIGYFFSQNAQELYEGLPRTLPIPSHNIGVEGAFKYYTGYLRLLAEYPVLKSEVLQSLREIGNILAMLHGIDQSISLSRVTTFMQAVPFLGVVPLGRARGLLCIPPEEGAQEGGYFADLTQRAGFEEAKKGNTHLLDNLYNTALRTEQLYVPSAVSSRMFPVILQRMEVMLAAVNTSWQNMPATDGSLDPGACDTFHRLWSSLLFIFYSPVTGDLPHQEIFGDGVLWAGTAMTALLGQEARFRMLDVSSSIVSIQTGLIRGLGEAAALSAKVTMTTSSDKNTAYFLEKVNRGSVVTNQLFEKMHCQRPLLPKALPALDNHGNVLPGKVFVPQALAAHMAHVKEMASNKGAMESNSLPNLPSFTAGATFPQMPDSPAITELAKKRKEPRKAAPKPVAEPPPVDNLSSIIETAVRNSSVADENDAGGADPSSRNDDPLRGSHNFTSGKSRSRLGAIGSFVVPNT